MNELPVIFAASALKDPMLLMFVGTMVTCVVTLITYSNWRLGLKIAFIMVLIEGAMRKWVMPGAQELAYFAKDIFLIGPYLKFFLFPDPELRARRLRIPGGIIALCSIVASFSALNPNIGSPLLAVYGIKIYFFYLPLVFMVPYLFRTRQDLENNVFWFAMMATPICLLGIAQHSLPGDNFLNMYAQGSEGTTMGWEGSAVRVTGTFSYISGHTTFLIIFSALHMGLLINKMPRWQWMCLVCNLPLLGANTIMNGARATLYSVAFIGAGFLLISMCVRVNNGGNIVLRVGLVAGIIAIAMSQFFGTAKEQYAARFKSAEDGVYYRVLGMAVGATKLALQQGGFGGMGIGMTHPAQAKLRNVLKIPNPKQRVPVYDNEVGQVLVELGLAGWLAWYTVRVLLLILTLRSLQICSEGGIIRSLAAVALLIEVPHFTLGVVLNHTANFLVFAFIGVAMIPLLEPAVQRRQHAGRAAPLTTAPPPPAMPNARGARLSQTWTSR